MLSTESVIIRKIVVRMNCSWHPPKLTDRVKVENAQETIKMQKEVDEEPGRKRILYGLS